MPVGTRRWGLAVAVALVLASCSSEPDVARGEASTTVAPSAPASSTTAPTMLTTTTTTPVASGPSRPDWLGTRLLPLRPDGFGEVLPTPPELVDRRLPTVDLLAPPADGRFTATVTQVPDDVVARSSWQPACPVGLNELRYVTVVFWGFDDGAHTGELLVNAAVADPMVEVFRRLFDARFPIEEMRIIRTEEIDAHPTGDGNTTTSFVCRPAVGSGNWSRHAYGLAVDINPFHNPYIKGDLVLPELASAYLDRDSVRPGMIVEGDPVTAAFGDLGWGWGGRWRSLLDYMHFSDNNR
jgi:D-alanyl-D-alanine carboxypeptidase